MQTGKDHGMILNLDGMDGLRISNVTYCKLNKRLKILHFFERKKKISKLIKGGVGIKISRVEKFQKINDRGEGGDDYSEPESTYKKARKIVVRLEIT